MKKKLVIITGGTRGIGAEIVKNLLKKNYKIIFTYQKNKSIASEIESLSPLDCKGCKIDSSSFVEVSNFVDEITLENKIDTLINNAGITIDGLIEDLQWEEYKKIFDVNMGGLFNYCKKILPHMRQNKNGNVINIASSSSHNIREGNALYGASKAAVERFTQSIAFEYSKYNIAANCISPRFIITDMNRKFLSRDDVYKAIISRTPSRLLPTCKDVADMVLFLLSRQPALFGVSIPITGGAHLHSDE